MKISDVGAPSSGPVSDGEEMGDSAEDGIEVRWKRGCRHGGRFSSCVDSQVNPWGPATRTQYQKLHGKMQERMRRAICLSVTLANPILASRSSPC